MRAIPVTQDLLLSCARFELEFALNAKGLVLEAIAQHVIEAPELEKKSYSAVQVRRDIEKKKKHTAEINKVG